jgi:hypothetical protein
VRWGVMICIAEAWDRERWLAVANALKCGEFLD